MGGGKGGADFDPKGKSDNEIRKFCVAFMRELSKHIGASTDVPAGDIGVSPREIGWMFGCYRAQKNIWEGALTGKGGDFGGSLIRPEATGYGLVYYVNHMIEWVSGGKETFKGKRVAISGSGNVAQYAALKAIELGATIVSLSDSKGSLIATDDKGITPELVHEIAQLKVERKQLTTLAKSDKFKFVEGERPWKHVGKVDVALPSATQNEVSSEEAKALIEAGCKFIAEGSNMGCEQDAIAVFEEHRSSKKGAEGIWYGPGKAANAGGVAVSGLEMAQNSSRLKWTSEEVDEKLKGIMTNCFEICVNTSQEYVKPKTEGELPSLVAGANIAGFSKVAGAMLAQGMFCFRFQPRTGCLLITLRRLVVDSSGLPHDHFARLLPRCAALRSPRHAQSVTFGSINVQTVHRRREQRLICITSRQAFYLHLVVLIAFTPICPPIRLPSASSS